ncbi:phospholipid-translocating P-type ATPase [Sesbania bispinosa]|nr:phospholipid-translocating P-type ATPase [Sesbania bispinosa]
MKCLTSQKTEAEIDEMRRQQKRQRSGTRRRWTRSMISETISVRSRSRRQVTMKQPRAAMK